MKNFFMYLSDENAEKLHQMKEADAKIDPEVEKMSDDEYATKLLCWGMDHWPVDQGHICRREEDPSCNRYICYLS